MLARLPKSGHPSLLVGFEDRDDAGVFALPGGQALVQTIDFFTPVVDDPLSYGRIAAANALSDVYAMGGEPVTALGVACFDPTAAEPDVWAEIMRGMAEKVEESGAALVGGHSVEDDEPKFGLAVTGLIEPGRQMTNGAAKAGDRVLLSKPLGTGIVTTAAKHGVATEEELRAAIDAMQTLNAEAAQAALKAGIKCATDITGFGLLGHLWNIAEASNVGIRINASSLPLLPGVERLVAEGATTGGAGKNHSWLSEHLTIGDVPKWLVEVALDPQTSGGLACLGTSGPGELIGEVLEGPARLELV